MTWICLSCGWVNDPSSLKARARKHWHKDAACDLCGTTRGEIRNVAWIVVPLDDRERHPCTKHEQPKRETIKVRTWSDGIAWG